MSRAEAAFRRALAAATEAERARPRDERSDRRLCDAYANLLRAYKTVAAAQGAALAPDKTTRRAVARALLHLGGEPDRASRSLADYDARRFGPFLGVSDEGSAAPAIVRAAFDSPKMRALRRASPFELGVAMDAERLAAIGEVVVGPDEYATIWPLCAGRLFVSTNIGTRANVRFYKRRARITVPPGDRATAVAQAKRALEIAAEPHLSSARPLCILLELAEGVARRPMRDRLGIVREFGMHFASLKGFDPNLHRLGIAVRIGWGKKGRDAVIDAIDLVAGVGLEAVEVDGVVRKDADAAMSLSGLLQYLAPGLVGPILRHAAKNDVRMLVPNTPDPDTVARSVYAGLATARAMGLHLGKYGLFPLTFEESERVIEMVQSWFSGWSAAPVYFVDQGSLSASTVDVGHDVVRGLRGWLKMVARHGVRIVLVDTIDKAKGMRLVKSRAQPKGLLSLGSIGRIDAEARKIGVKVLWAGGLDLREVFELGKLGVFGVYATTVAAEPRPARPRKWNDPSLVAEKEPTYEGVLRVKTLLEAGFLAGKLPRAWSAKIDAEAEALLDAAASKDARRIPRAENALASTVRTAWKRQLA